MDSIEGFLNTSIYDNFDLVILTEFFPLDFTIKLNNLLRTKDKSMIITACAGMLGFVFTDFG